MRTKILIVEDHPDCREVLRVQMQVLGYEVVEAERGDKALERALEDRPDLIIMDLALPGMDGIEATARLKGDPRTSPIPVVAYTACDLEERRGKAESVGIAGFLTKPASIGVFRVVIEKALKKAL